MTSMERAQERFRDRVETEQRVRATKAWLADFNRMIRRSNWQLNVEHRRPRTVAW